MSVERRVLPYMLAWDRHARLLAWRPHGTNIEVLLIGSIRFVAEEIVYKPLAGIDKLILLRFGISFSDQHHVNTLGRVARIVNVNSGERRARLAHEVAVDIDVVGEFLRELACRVAARIYLNSHVVLRIREHNAFRHRLAHNLSLWSSLPLTEESAVATRIDNLSARLVNHLKHLIAHLAVVNEIAFVASPVRFLNNLIEVEIFSIEITCVVKVEAHSLLFEIVLKLHLRVCRNCCSQGQHACCYKLVSHIYYFYKVYHIYICKCKESLPQNN